MSLLNEDYKQEINSIFGELYENIFKNKLTYEITEGVKGVLKTYKNNYDEKLNNLLKDEVNTVSGHFKEEFEKFKIEFDEEIKKSLKNEINTISDCLKSEFEKFKTEFDDEIRKSLKNEINTISDYLKSEFEQYKIKQRESDEMLSKEIKNEIRQDFNETKKSIWVSTKKILRKYLFRKDLNIETTAGSQIVSMRWLILVTILLNVVTLIIVLSK